MIVISRVKWGPYKWPYIWGEIDLLITGRGPPSKVPKEPVFFHCKKKEGRV